MTIRKFLLVMLLCGSVFCSTAVMATTQTAIDNVLDGTAQLDKDNRHGIFDFGNDGSSTYDGDVTIDGADLDWIYPPIITWPEGDDSSQQQDEESNESENDQQNDESQTEESQIENPQNEEPQIETPQIEEPQIEETKPVYDPLLNNNIITATVLSSNSINYYSVRNLSNIVSDRLDELVSADDSVSSGTINGANDSVSVGGWGGAGGSKTGSSGSYKNEATYYEVGYDQLIKNTDYEKQYLGFSLTYNRGSIKYNGMTGDGKERDETVAIYRLSKYKHGQYLSLVGTVGLYSNSYDLWDPEGYNESAKNRTYGFSGTVGYGRKIYFNGGDWYLDPHATVTYSYLADNKYSISNGVDVTNGGMSDLIGKVGVTCGKRFGWQNAGLAYLRCSWSHEFMGDYKTTMRYNDTGSRITVTGDIRESWFDYGAGVSYKLSENNVASIYVGKSTGGNCYKDWVWSVGFKWAF